MSNTRVTRGTVVNAKAYVAAASTFVLSLFTVLVATVPEEGFVDLKSGAFAVGAALVSAVASGRLTWRVPNAPQVDEGLEAVDEEVDVDGDFELPEGDGEVDEEDDL